MFEGARYHDISPKVSEHTAVFPQDTAFSRQVALDFRRGHNLTLSSIVSTLHLGAHADAPSHYHPAGVAIDQRPLDRYFGPCQVVTVKAAPGERVLPRHLSAPISAPRVLFRTQSFPNPDAWRSDFNSLSAPLVDHLADQRVLLVGIDTPSVDPAADKLLEAHQAIYRRDLAILEGLWLEEVPDGRYTLIALPLRIAGADASPVRAILIED